MEMKNVTRRLRRVRPEWLKERGMGASVVVAFISTVFGGLLLTASGYLSARLVADEALASSSTVQLILDIMGWVLIALAVYVGGVVTANTFSTVVAGRTRLIALMRLVGASARSQRVGLSRMGLVVGAIGAALGLVVAVTVGAVGVPIVEHVAVLSHVPYSVVRPVMLLPAVIVVVTTWAAAWVGTRRVLAVTPLEALGSSVEPPHEELLRRRGRNATALVLVVLGVLLLAAGILVGFATPLGVVIAFVGGLFSFTGIAIGAVRVMPPVLALVGRLMGRGAVGRLAAENALRFPERSSRMMIGIVIGVSLVTMFAVALETTEAALIASAGAADIGAFVTFMNGLSAVMTSLVAMAALTAAVGLVNLLTLAVGQRRRELGLLRTLGLSVGQVRALVVLEATQLIAAALVVGLALGTVYGWAGAQSLLGSMPTTSGVPMFVLPAVPLLTVIAIVAATVILTALASVAPTRLATRVAPIGALRQ